MRSPWVRRAEPESPRGGADSGAVGLWFLAQKVLLLELCHGPRAEVALDPV